jgi:hypothetical protein
MQAKTQSPNEHERELRVAVSCDRADLKVDCSLIGVVVHLARTREKYRKHSDERD